MCTSLFPICLGALDRGQCGWRMTCGHFRLETESAVYRRLCHKLKCYHRPSCFILQPSSAVKHEFITAALFIPRKRHHVQLSPTDSAGTGPSSLSLCCIITTQLSLYEGCESWNNSKLTHFVQNACVFIWACQNNIRSTSNLCDWLWLKLEGRQSSPAQSGFQQNTEWFKQAVFYQSPWLLSPALTPACESLSSHGFPLLTIIKTVLCASVKHQSSILWLGIITARHWIRIRVVVCSYSALAWSFSGFLRGPLQLSSFTLIVLVVNWSVMIFY